MLKFDEEFFKGEYRDGFYIESMVKKLWAENLNMLNWISYICDKYNIRWYADSGTLLGAVRHHGYVPWDDDVDIAMPREEIPRFEEAAKRELPSKYIFREGGVTCPEVASILWNNIYKVDYSPKTLEEHYGLPYSVSIDINPLDTVSMDDEVRNLQYVIYYTLNNIVVELKADSISKEEAYSQYIEMLTKMGMDYSEEWIKDTTPQLLARINNTKNQISQVANGTDSEYIGPPWFVCGELPFSRWIKKEWYEKTIDMPFENITVKVPHKYDEILTVHYGENWRTPVRGTAAHIYPCYNEHRFLWEKNQAIQVLQQVLKQTTGQEIPIDIKCEQVSYDDYFGVYEIESDGEKYVIIVPTAEYTRSDLFVYKDQEYQEKKKNVMDTLKTVIYDGGNGSFLCGLGK